LEIPVVSGNVSFYNETDGRAILPTPTVAVVGLIEDASRFCGMAFGREGDCIAILGETRGELGGSELLKALHGKIAGAPPRLNAQSERALQRALRELIRAELLSSAHDCSEGGLAVALAESCIAGAAPIGARVSLEPGSTPVHAYLFGEDASRAVISFSPSIAARVVRSCQAANVPCALVGDVGGTDLVIEGILSVPVPLLARAWRSGIPAVLKPY
jgi:phosphoribosylformylglycinamidine synthase